MDKILTVGNNSHYAEALAHLENSKDKIEFVSIDDVEKLIESNSIKPINKPFIIHAQPKVELYPEQKQFVCKGKHQYRQVLEESEGCTISTWVCQCGEKLKKNK